MMTASGAQGSMVHMPKNPPESMQHHLRVRLNEHAKQRWPAIERVEVRFRTGFAYIDGVLPDAQIQKLCRLKIGGVVDDRGFPMSLASKDGYEQAILPQTGWPAGSPEDALDTACGLYLGDPTAWLTNPS